MTAPAQTVVLLLSQEKTYNIIIRRANVLSPVTIGAVTTEETEAVESRYSLAVFYHATNGSEWISAARWLDGNADECNWEILFCSVCLNLGKYHGSDITVLAQFYSQHETRTLFSIQ